MEVDFAKVMGDIREIAEAEQRDAEELVDEMAESALKKVIKKSPRRLLPYSGKKKKRRPGRYADGWRHVTEMKYGSKLHVIRNVNEPELTNILEFGTAPRTTDEGYNRGAAPKHPHIRAAFDETIAEYDMKNRRKQS